MRYYRPRTHHYRRTDEYHYGMGCLGSLLKHLWWIILFVGFWGGVLGLILMQRDHSTSSMTLVASTTPASNSVTDVLFDNQKFAVWQHNFMDWLRPRVLFSAVPACLLGLIVRRLFGFKKEGRAIILATMVIVVIVLFGPLGWDAVNSHVSGIQFPHGG